LEIAAEADMLVHVVDASAVHPEQQITAVREVLAEIGADQVPEFIVFNKADLVDDWGASLVEDHQGAVAVSALRNEGLEVMMRRLADRMRAITQVTELMVPYEVVLSELEDGGMRIRARLSSASEGRLREFVVPLTNQRN
jgi:GTP-binding protein HflX